MWFKIDIHISYILECGAKADVVFTLDSSGSVGSANWQIILKFVQDVVNIFTIGRNDVQIGVDIFGSSVSTKIKLNSYDSKTQITSAVGQIGFLSGGTNTVLAIQHMTRNSFSSSYGTMMLLFLHKIKNKMYRNYDCIGITQIISNPFKQCCTIRNRTITKTIKLSESFLCHYSITTNVV